MWWYTFAASSHDITPKSVSSAIIRHGSPSIHWKEYLYPFWWTRSWHFEVSVVERYHSSHHSKFMFSNSLHFQIGKKLSGGLKLNPKDWSSTWSRGLGNYKYSRWAIWSMQAHNAVQQVMQDEISIWGGNYWLLNSKLPHTLATLTRGDIVRLSSFGDLLVSCIYGNLKGWLRLELGLSTYLSLSLSRTFLKNPPFERHAYFLAVLLSGDI